MDGTVEFVGLCMVGGGFRKTGWNVYARKTNGMVKTGPPFVVVAVGPDRKTAYT